MKKILQNLFLAATVFMGSIVVNAQSPRLQLFEYFDNTSIPTFGAATNAYFDSLANANSDKITFIKYHVAWGSQTGTEPMNLQNPAQVESRVSYYGVTQDPQGYQDGAVVADNTFSGDPVNFTQANIDDRDTSTSPFTIRVSHNLNFTGDSIQTHTVITKTGAVSGTPVLYVVVIEKLVHFPTAPGISGDVNFRNVMKRMLPSASGSILPSMSVGDSLVYNLEWELANVYDTAQLAVISFVQDNGTHEVYQAGYSAPLPQPNDAGISAVNVTPVFGCDSFSPVVVLNNYGTSTLTACAINYQIDDASPSTFSWTGNLTSGSSVSVPLLPKIFATGYHQLTAFTSNPNGSTDYDANNDSASTWFAIAFQPQANPVNEGFEETLFPPANWELGSFVPSLPWQQAGVGGFGTSTHSAMLNCYDNWYGAVDDLYPPALNLIANTSYTYCTFDVAYAQASSLSEDTLEVNVSTDCGATWLTLYSKSDTSLATAPDTTGFFVPTSLQWRRDTADLTDYNGLGEVQIQFHGISGYGNVMYVDNVNVNVTAPAGIAAVTQHNSINVYPNPGTGNVNIQLGSAIENGTLNLFSIEGQNLLQLNGISGSTFSLDLTNRAKGIYFLKITDGQNNTVGVEKIVLE